MTTAPDRAPGRLVALEGVDGCGKSTQVARLCRLTGALATFEPGATGLGAAVRRLLLDPELPPVSTRAEALLMAADRAQHVAELVAPTLAAGRWVVTDRFDASTLAYQGAGRGLVLDELRLTVFPVAVGAGERLFGETSDKRPLRLIHTKTVGNGLAHLTYERAREA